MSRECIEHSYFEELAAGVYEQRARAPALRARVVRRRALRSGTEFGLKQKGRSHNHHSYGEAHASSSAAKPTNDHPPERATPMIHNRHGALPRSQAVSARVARRARKRGASESAARARAPRTPPSKLRVAIRPLFKPKSLARHRTRPRCPRRTGWVDSASTRTRVTPTAPQAPRRPRRRRGNPRRIRLRRRRTRRPRRSRPSPAPAASGPPTRRT